MFGFSSLDLTSSSLFIGQVVVGAVNSEEDHGFTIDIGKPRFSSFLPSKDVGKTPLEVALLCSVSL